MLSCFKSQVKSNSCEWQRAHQLSLRCLGNSGRLCKWPCACVKVAVSPDLHSDKRARRASLTPSSQSPHNRKRI